MSSDMSDSSKRELAANLTPTGKPGDTHVVPPAEVKPIDATGSPSDTAKAKALGGDLPPVGGDYGIKDDEHEGDDKASGESDDDPTFRSTAGGKPEDDESDTDSDDAGKGDDGSDSHAEDEAADDSAKDGDAGSGGSGSGGGKPPAPPSGGDDGKDDDKKFLRSRVNIALERMKDVRIGSSHAEALDKKLAEATYLLEPLLIGPITDDDLKLIKDKLFQLVGEIEIEANKLLELKSRKTLERATDVINRVKKKHGL